VKNSEPAFFVDVLCVGHAAFDLVFSVERHPAPDEKTIARSLLSCGGGPAANAAVAVSRLGCTAAFAGYLGNDVFGDMQLAELRQEGVNVDLVVRGDAPTPLSAILVKPDGKRTVINHGAGAKPLPQNSVDFSRCIPKVILIDGHEPELSFPLARDAKQRFIPTVLDAGSVHRGTQELVGLADYVIASEKFAVDFTGETDAEQALVKLSTHARSVVITLGERGLIWKNSESDGRLSAFAVNVVDTTGAGDAFHGAFAAGLAKHMKWDDLLRYASAVGALCCMKLGARRGLPTLQQVNDFLGSAHARLL
jgi:sulfofructose kinase